MTNLDFFRKVILPSLSGIAIGSFLVYQSTHDLTMVITAFVPSLLLIPLAYVMLRVMNKNRDQEKTVPPANETQKKSKRGFYIRLVFLIVIVPMMYEVSKLNHNAIERCNHPSVYPEGTVASCTILLSSVKDDAQRAIIYEKRAIANNDLKKSAQAMQDANTALSLNPNLEGALAIRGSLYVTQAQYKSAEDDFEKITPAFFDKYKNDPKTSAMPAGILFERGVAKFFTASPTAAIDDLASSLQINAQISPDLIMWLYFVKARAGIDGKDEFAKNVDHQALNDQWPAPIYNFYEGKITADDVFAKAKSGSEDKQDPQLCDANFYVAEFYLTEKKSDQAAPLFQQAWVICKPDDIEKYAAQFELNGLGKYISK